jgi:hypothetical protein
MFSKHKSINLEVEKNVLFLPSKGERVTDEGEVKFYHTLIFWNSLISQWCNTCLACTKLGVPSSRSTSTNNTPET